MHSGKCKYTAMKARTAIGESYKFPRTVRASKARRVHSGIEWHSGIERERFEPELCAIFQTRPRVRQNVRARPIRSQLSCQRLSSLLLWCLLPLRRNRISSPARQVLQQRSPRLDFFARSPGLDFFAIISHISGGGNSSWSPCTPDG